MQLEENKMLADWTDVKKSSWEEDIETVRKIYTAIVSSDLYASYIDGSMTKDHEEDSTIMHTTASSGAVLTRPSF